MQILVETTINAPLDQVWTRYTEPSFITQWNFASPEWCCPSAESDLRPGGEFRYRMEARDGSVGFDFSGTYTEVIPQERIAYAMGDGRRAEVMFASQGAQTQVRVTFDAESQNSPELQKTGWQAILDNFKQCAEA